MGKLGKLNIPACDIQTRNLSVNRIDYGNNRGKYEANNTLTVRVRDTGRVGPAIGAVTAAGTNIVSGPNLSVADPEKASLGAYGIAYKAARAKAKPMPAPWAFASCGCSRYATGAKAGICRPCRTSCLRWLLLPRLSRHLSRR